MDLEIFEEDFFFELLIFSENDLIKVLFNILIKL